MDDRVGAVPLPERLRHIRKDYRLSVAFQWSEGGLETGHHRIPVGHLMHEAADEIERLERELAAARSTAEPVAWFYRRTSIRDAEHLTIHTDNIIVWQFGAKRPEGKHWKPLYAGAPPTTPTGEPE